ncbi:MAG: MarR family transcriptional regulator [Clostridia bacterium]|nr:MarR family transcriptional regulator [Clostridia bacterium]
MNINEVSFGKYISVIMRHQRIVLDHAFKKFGFSSGQHGFFLEIATHEGLNQKELADRRKMTKGTTNKAIKKLEEDGFVRTQIDPSDKRLHCVFLTDHGREIVFEVRKTLMTYSQNLTEGLDDDTKTVVYRALEHMATNVKTMADQIKGDSDA